MQVLGYIGVAAGLALGLLGLFRPTAALRLVGLSLNPQAPHGISEVRATYGGLFIGLEAAILLGGESQLTLVGAMAWCGAALARVASMAIDRRWTRENAGGTALELVIGLLHTAPLLAAGGA